VRVPRVLESPVALECKLHSTLPMGDCVLVFGEVTHAVVASRTLEGSHPRIDLLEPLSRLGLDEWGTTGAVREVKRIRKADWPRGFRRKDGSGALAGLLAATSRPIPGAGRLLSGRMAPSTAAAA
jgi:hypothetical protein